MPIKISINAHIHQHIIIYTFMKLLIKKILSLELWNLFDVQFANILTTSSFPSDKKNNLQLQKKIALMFASTCLSAHIRLGHTCLPLSILSSNQLFQNYYPELNNEIIKKTGKLSIDDWQDILSSTSAVGDGSKISPLVLENKCLYLYRTWQDECTVAQFFNYSYNKKNFFQEKKMITVLNQLFSKTYHATTINWQKIATALSLIHPRVIISGGPGTGKTSVIHKIITALLLMDNNLKIKMATPTGKASTVLTNSCHTILYDLHQLNHTQKYIKIPKATTLHSLLRFQLYKTNNTYNCLNLNILDIDYLIIDEASMIGLSVLSKLISVLPQKIKTIFLGDHNQLYSVEPGSVFQDICKFANMYYSPDQRKKLIDLTDCILPISNNFKTQYNYNQITDGTCILKKNYRFNKNSGIGQLASSIKLGDHNRSLSLLKSKIYADLHYTNIENQKHYITMMMDCAIKYSKYLKMLQQHKTLIIKILKTFHHYRILCALRNGPFGVIKLNHYIEQILNYIGLITLNNSGNYIGKPIMILRNDPELDLFNGDIGILLPNNQNYLVAYFLLPQDKIKTVHIHQLPEYETCFVMTIHKAQGSEFQCISIILPDKHLPILTKELLYTSITRAHDQLFLYSKDEVLIRSINFNTKRYSGLYDKIRKSIYKKTN